MNGLIKFSTNLTLWVWLFFYVFAVNSFAGSSTKTFDFGAGGDNPTFRSHARAFSPPQGVAIAVTVNYRTAGDALIALVVEVENSENAVVASRDASAEKKANRLTINIAAGENTVGGCEKPWQVRVKSRDGQIPSARVFGDITFSFVDPPAANISVEGIAFNLSKDNHASKRIGNNNSFKHPGVLSIRASWTHNPLAQALALKFELVRPDGSVAKSFTGYGTNSNGNPKLDFSYNLTVMDVKQNGVWQLRVSNNTEHEILEINPQISFRPICGN